MKYYLVESTIKTTDTDRESRGTVEKHHEFLEKGFDEGRILFSGPKSPVGSGDIMVVRGEGLDEVREFFMHDPVITSRVSTTPEKRLVPKPSFLDRLPEHPLCHRGLVDPHNDRHVTSSSR